MNRTDVLRKMRIGQLQGGVFTGKVLGDIFSDVRSIEVPFNFYNDEKLILSKKFDVCAACSRDIHNLY